jgi:hypothetical protein
MATIIIKMLAIMYLIHWLIKPTMAKVRMPRIIPIKAYRFMGFLFLLTNSSVSFEKSQDKFDFGCGWL